jgi:hypothetical protein
MVNYFRFVEPANIYFISSRHAGEWDCTRYRKVRLSLLIEEGTGSDCVADAIGLEH